MNVVAWIIFAIAVGITIAWSYGMRQYIRAGEGAPIQLRVTVALWALAVIIVPLTGYSFFHLLWIFPLAFVIGLLATPYLSPLSPILAPLGQIYWSLLCIGLNSQEIYRKADLRRQFRSRVGELIASGLSADEAARRASEEMRNEPQKMPTEKESKKEASSPQERGESPQITKRAPGNPG